MVDYNFESWIAYLEFIISTVPNYYFSWIGLDLLTGNIIMAYSVKDFSFLFLNVLTDYEISHVQVYKIIYPVFVSD